MKWTESNFCCEFGGKEGSFVVKLDQTENGASSYSHRKKQFSNREMEIPEGSLSGKKSISD